jgi:hypothetical protein
VNYELGLGQAVSYQLLITAAWVQFHVSSYGIYGGQSGTGADFLLFLSVPLPIHIPASAPFHSAIIWVLQWTMYSLNTKGLLPQPKNAIVFYKDTKGLTLVVNGCDLVGLKLRLL